jgi:hypothetical protein
MRFSTTLKLPTYSCELVFVVTDKIKEETSKYYKKYKLTKDDKEDYEVEGILITADIDKYILIIDLKYLTHNTLAHEIYHATVRVTEDRDIVDEEAQAWLAGYISGVVYKFIQKKNLEVKHG